MHHKASVFTVNVLTTLVLVGSLGYAPESAAQTVETPGHDAQAIYLYNLAKFVRWPADAAHDKVTMCVTGGEAPFEALKKVATEEGSATPSFEVRAIERIDQQEGCDILFMESSTRDHADEWLAASAGKPEITVSDLSDFLDRGGMIQLEPAEGRVRFSVDLRPVARSGLTLSSELLKLATTVRGTASDGGAP